MRFNNSYGIRHFCDEQALNSLHFLTGHFGRVFAYTSCVEAAKIRHDTRALQHYLGHKNIQHTVRYTEMAPDRFKEFWRN